MTYYSEGTLWKDIKINIGATNHLTNEWNQFNFKSIKRIDEEINIIILINKGGLIISMFWACPITQHSWQKCLLLKSLHGTRKIDNIQRESILVMTQKAKYRF